MAVKAGQTLLHYRLIEKIGEGGMGVVWKAQDTRLHRHVALKFVPEEAAGSPQLVDRHIREARAASAMNHPHICSIHDIGEWEGRRFIVMELLEGKSLRDHIGGKPMRVEEAIDLAIQITNALDVAHAKGIIHRDIKTTNIFVTNTGQAKILDFGLAKLATGSAQGPGLDDNTMTALDTTKPGTVVGTILYMSPEQALGKDLDHRTDLFSLGVVLYEMITANRAFKGDSSAAVFDAILNREPTPTTAFNAEIPEELERIVNKALEKDVELRYQSAAELCCDLKRLKRNSSAERIAETPPHVAAGRGKRWIRVSGALALLLVVMFAVIVQQRSSRQDSAPAVKPSDTRVASRGPRIDVLPFTNVSGDADQDYFSSGLTEDIVTELSRYHELTVIAHSSPENFADRGAHIREAGNSTGASYVLKGSVRKAGQRIRVGVQLTNAVDGRLVWGTNYERDMTARDLFELQDHLAQQVVNEIAGSYGALTRAELPGARRRPPANLDSYDCVLRAYEYLHVHTPAKHLAARDCLEQVVESDPDYADGWAWLAYLYAEEYHHRRNERTDQYDALSRAVALADEAVRLDTGNHVAHGVLALTQFFSGEYERARIESLRTIDLNPNDTLWLALLGTYLTQQEDFENGLPMVRKVIALDPNPPGWITMVFFFDHYHHGRYEQALSEMRGVNLEGDFRGPLFFAATYGQLGRLDDAGRELDKLRAMWARPVGEIRQELIGRHAFSAGLTDHLMEGLTKAGLEGVGDSSTGGKASNE
jgi:serine/threonine protein kinase